MAQRKNTAAVSKTNNRAPVSAAPSYTQDQIALITKTVAQGATQDELKLFLHHCQRTGLDPLSNQIYFIKRRSRNGDGYESKPTIQAGIDGLRLIADRTGKYAPGDPAQFSYDKNGNIISAKINIKKYVNNEWHYVWGEAFFSEYAQRTKNGSLTHMWRDKPHIMLGKCAEALALRRGFPAELFGLYSHDEMQQADPPCANPATSRSQHQQAGKKVYEPEVVATPAPDPEKDTHKHEDPVLRCRNGLLRMGVPDDQIDIAFKQYLNQAGGEVTTLLSWLLQWVKEGLIWDTKSGALVRGKRNK